MKQLRRKMLVSYTRLYLLLLAWHFRDLRILPLLLAIYRRAARQRRARGIKCNFEKNFAGILALIRKLVPTVIAHVGRTVICRSQVNFNGTN